MQFTTSLLSLLAAAASVRALPNDKRQETPRIYAKFFDDNACQGTWVEDTVVSQSGSCPGFPMQCHSHGIIGNLEGNFQLETGTPLGYTADFRSTVAARACRYLHRGQHPLCLQQHLDCRQLGHSYS